MADTEKVKVALRVRPFNRREIELGTKCVVDMDPHQTMLYHPSVGMPSGADTPSGHAGNIKKQPKVFAFDHCFDSTDESSPKFSSQEMVFNCLGRDLLKHAFQGYNACIFAYGQTGSGKSYSMMGTNEQKGIIPRLCEGLFESIMETSDNSTSFKVEVSYMEIYNEKVRDLLDPKGGKHTLRVREHNILGPYVDDLSILAVSTFKDINALMSEGNKSRTVAATNMNSESSRSHAVFNIILTQTLTDLATGVSGEKVSKMSLVDLAGSERAQKTGAVGERLKEGSNINKSLTTLGLVISALADQASGKAKGKFVPYRDSVLTWLLKDNLGGNSKTVMVATLSPSADNYEETLSTLRYADRAKRIVNHAVVNEDPNARIIRELREEVDMLKRMLDEAQSMKAPDLRERLEESEKLMNDMSKTWEQKLIETERIHQERHAALEKMGISVQTSGIKVEQGKYYLVNLNADPSLNELLVYYLKEHTMVGRPDAPTEQDIQLSGLGIMPEHCIVDLETSDVFISPIEGARTCVNGRTITSKTRVKHGDRILWGNNHFFRINCPKANSPSAETPEQNIDYDFAQQELMMQEMGDDPIQDAIEAMEKQHEEEKAEALEKQRQMYERQMQMLRSQLMSPSTPSQPYPPFFDPFTKMSLPGSTNSNMHPKYQQWAQEREKLFKASLSKLKEEVVRANALVREANFLAQEMGKETEFFVTLQIPAGNLSPNRKRGAFVSEPAILVKRREKGSQIWCMDKFENKIFDMREMYEERKEKGLPMMDEGPPAKGDPFYESQENHNLIGVANIFLEALFYDVKLDYHVPIISQQGEVAGRLHIELSRLATSLPDRNIDVESLNSEDLENMDEENGVAIGSVVVCRVCIKEARGLPPALSNFVFCQYSFWGHPEPIVIPPQVNADVNGLSRKRNDSMSFVFDHSNEFTVHVTEEFMEHCTEGALSIEVWGHRAIGFGQNLPGWELDPVVAKSRSIMDRWSELTRKIEMWVEVHEINDQGEYMPVEVNTKAEVLTGGVVQLRQGHSRRILVQAKPVQNSGTLPIICESITHVSIGCVCARSKLQKGLDSYQEEDLTVLREKWSSALNKRKEYLDEQLQRTMNKEDKNDTDKDREKSLIDQWVCLTEERNAVLVPAAGSGIPGAPADWDPEAGMEQHIPVIFLDLNAEDMSTPQVKEGMQAAGVNSILPKEHGAKFYTLPFVKNSEKDVTAVVSWDSSIHDSVHLNRVTPNNERVYLILKTVVRLSHPASMELVLRKRICINVYKRQSLTDKLKKRIGKSDSVFSTGVTYEVVSNIPKASEDLEDRESLAQMAASTHEINASDGETYIEKYIRGVSAVESILTLDRLRQEVAIKELLAARGRPLRKSTSVPNIHNILTSPRGLDEQMRTDSLQDLSYGGGDRFASLPKQFTAPFDFRHRGASEDMAKELMFGKDGALLPSKPTGPFSLASPKAGASPQPTKLVKPMKTLVEEQHVRETKPLLNRTDTDDSDDDEFAKLKTSPSKKTTTNPAQNDTAYDSDDFTEFESYQENQPSQFPLTAADSANTRSDSMTHSSTNESLTDIQAAKSFTPSMSSSGYGSQAVSTQTLSSEDSASVRSMSIDDTPDQDGKDKKPMKPTTLDVEPIKDCTPEKEAVVVHKDNVVREKETVPASKTLIDIEDVPSNLGTPLQPSSPQGDEDEDTKTLAHSNGHDDASEDTEVSQAKEVQSLPEKEQNKAKSEESKTNKSDNESSEEDVVVSKSNDRNVDLYSETAMDELEALGEAEVDVSMEATPKQKPAAATAKATKNTTTKTKMDANANPTEEQQESRDKFEETPRRGSDEKVIRRRSWHEKLDRRSNTVDESSSPSSKTEVKLRKGGSIDVSRPGSLKKLRSGEQKAGKGTPSPVKATYRPMSMPVDHLVSAMEENLDNSMDVDDNSDNDDGMSICSFGSRADLHRLGEAAVPSWVQPGEPVIVLSSRGGASVNGSVQFVGTTEFAGGNWVGVALDTADGKNDGSVKGIRYFKCRQRHGIFVRHDKLIMDKKRKGVKMRNVSPSLRRSTGNLSSAIPHKDSGSFLKGTAASNAKFK